MNGSSGQEKPLFFFEKQAFSSPRTTQPLGSHMKCGWNLGKKIFNFLSVARTLQKA